MCPCVSANHKFIQRLLMISATFKCLTQRGGVGMLAMYVCVGMSYANFWRRKVTQVSYYAKPESLYTLLSF